MYRIIYSANNYLGGATKSLERVAAYFPDVNWRFLGCSFDILSWDARLERNPYIPPELGDANISVFCEKIKVLPLSIINYRIESERRYLNLIGHPELINKYPIAIEGNWFGELKLHSSKPSWRKIK